MTALLDRPLAISYRPIDSVMPYARNARTHPKRQVDQIVASIRQFGFSNPILVDTEGRIIAGHGRLLAAKAIGLPEVPTIELSGLTRAHARALRLADNKIALGATRANAFDIRYADDVDPKGERWELCERVLARHDVVDRLSRPWGARDRRPA